MTLRDFITLPAIIMLLVGIFLSGWFMAMFNRGKNAVSS